LGLEFAGGPHSLLILRSVYQTSGGLKPCAALAALAAASGARALRARRTGSGPRCAARVRLASRPRTSSVTHAARASDEARL